MFFRKKKPIQDIVTTLTKREFSTLGFDTLLHYVKKEIGVDLFSKQSVIENRLRLFCDGKDIYNFKELLEAIQHKSDLRQDLINLLTVNETYFYREERQLQEAIDFALSKNGKVDILCAPCASGEEVYSLAMMLNEQINFTITGIDINTEAIKKAKDGVYSQRSLHKLSDALKNKYFDTDKNIYKIKKHLFSSVKFSRENIFENSFLQIGKFDIIFSRNMLIYFDNDFRVATMKQFASLLKNEGRVYLGHADIVPDNTWLTKNRSGASCYYSK